MKVSRTITLIAVMCFLFPLSSPAEQPEKIKKTIEQSIETRTDTQERSAEWQSRKERLKSRYYQLKDHIEATQLEVKHMQDVTARQKAYIDRMQTRIIEMEKIRQNLVPFLEEVTARMGKSINDDLPFLVQERTNRIRALNELIYDPELTMGEKLRRVFEGVRVEMDYGKSVETTKEEIEFEGEPLMVQVLRLGRTALLMQTLDEEEVGMYDGSSWVKLPGKYRDEIHKAVEITQRRRPIEFVNLPVKGAAQ